MPSRMNSNLPSRKVGVSALAAALSTVFLSFVPIQGDSPTPGLEAAIVTIVTFALGYLVPPSSNDVAVSNSSGGSDV